MLLPDLGLNLDLAKQEREEIALPPFDGTDFNF